jgi:branched-chain amino acid transport system substrate-binding protein
VLAKQLRQNNVEAIWIGSPSTANAGTLKRAGADLNGAYAVTDFAAESSSTAAAFDAVHLLAKAISSAGGTEPEKIRTAILTIRDYQGVEGTYNFDQNGDGLRGYNIVHNDNGRWVLEKHVEFGLGE